MKTKWVVAMLAVTGLTLGGCRKVKQEDSTANYKSAIDTYYAAKPMCLWAQPKKLPVQADTSDTSKTSGYDALVDQGLLQRTTAEKKVFVVASRQVTNYDLSEHGRGSWTADQTQPGFGNFCYGTPSVSSIDSASPTNNSPGATTVVNYHTTLSGVPEWARATETQTAYPQVQQALAGPVAGTATLTDTDHGWVVTQGPAVAADSGITPADTKVVQ
jgi:hypothetical protein